MRPLSEIDKGLLTLPCLISHFVQIVMDAAIASRWKHELDQEVAASSITVPGRGPGAGPAGKARVARRK